jgi:hypothetical protein
MVVYNGTVLPGIDQMRTFAIATIMIALLSVSAFAQERRTTRTDEQKQADTEIDQAYKNVIKNTGGNKRSAPAQDPWGTVRPSGASNDRR